MQMSTKAALWKPYDGTPLNRYLVISNYLCSFNEPIQLSDYLKYDSYKNNNVCKIMSKVNVVLRCKGYDADAEE